MFIARVRGNVVTTQKVIKMTGRKLLVIEPLRVDESGGKITPTGKCFVAVDSIGAGTEDLVLVTQGSSARMTETTADAPVDAVVVGIIDTVTTLDKLIYRKGQND
jgi:ethanolamine utilization protein EutN